jgi:hypothetical protein
LKKEFFFRKDSANLDDFRLEQEMDIIIIISRYEDNTLQIYWDIASETGYHRIVTMAWF